MTYDFGNSGTYDATLEHWEHDTFVANYRDRHAEPEFITFSCEPDGQIHALEVRSLDLFVDKFRRIS